MVQTEKIIAVAVGVIFIALAATGLQYYFTGMMESYDISYSDSGYNFTLFNGSSYQGLKNATTELESKFGENADPSGSGVSFTDFFDTTWNSIKSGVASIYYSLGITKDMVQGTASGVGAVTGVGVGWLMGGLIAIIAITLILFIIGWWMNR